MVGCSLPSSRRLSPSFSPLSAHFPPSVLVLFGPPWSDAEVRCIQRFKTSSRLPAIAQGSLYLDARPLKSQVAAPNCTPGACLWLAFCAASYSPLPQVLPFNVLSHLATSDFFALRRISAACGSIPRACFHLKPHVAAHFVY